MRYNSQRFNTQWVLSLLLGSICYAVANGLVHFSDWCYLAASVAVAAVVSAGLRPLHRWQVARRPRRLLWALGCTLAVFGVGVLLTWPLRSWPGPSGLWPWGAGALLTTMLEHWWLTAHAETPEIGTTVSQEDKPATPAGVQA